MKPAIKASSMVELTAYGKGVITKVTPKYVTVDFSAPIGYGNKGVRLTKQIFADLLKDVADRFIQRKDEDY